MIAFRNRRFLPTVTFFLAGALLLLPVADLVPALAAKAQDKCESELAEAENKYQLGELDAAIELVNQCLKKTGLTLEESEKAYKLLGKAYHAKGLLEEARQNLRKLLELIPNWRPNPEVDPPSFQRLAEEVIREMEERKTAPPAVEEQPTPKPEPERAGPPPSKKGGKGVLFVVGGVGLLGVALALGIIIDDGNGNGNGNGTTTTPTKLADPPPLPPVP